MSYIKTGCAGHWATREFEQEAKNGSFHFIDWLDFEDEFRNDFMPLDSEAAAINVLETTTYFQGKWTVNDYLDQFRDLIYNSGYTNLKTVVVKFHQGLDRRISTALAGMASGRLVLSHSPDGSEPCGRRGFPCLSPTTLHPDSCHEPPSSDILTQPSCTCPALRTLQPVPGQSSPDGHRHDTEDQGHSRHLPALRKDWTLGKGMRPLFQRPIHGHGRDRKGIGE